MNKRRHCGLSSVLGARMRKSTRRRFGVNVGEIHLFDSSSERKSLAAGTLLFDAGDIGDAMYAVISGEIDIVINGSTVETVGAGGILGELALVDDGPRAGAAVARSEAVVVAVAPDAVRRSRRTTSDVCVAGDGRHGRSLAWSAGALIRPMAPARLGSAGRVSTIGPHAAHVLGRDARLPEEPGRLRQADRHDAGRRDGAGRRARATPTSSSSTPARSSRRPRRSRSTPCSRWRDAPAWRRAGRHGCMAERYGDELADGAHPRAC